jgi:hypothetical protein
MKDEAGIVQLWIVSPNGGKPEQITQNPRPIGSAFTWSPDGRFIGHVMDGSVAVTEVAKHSTQRLTQPGAEQFELRPEACVFSPDGQKIAFVRRVREEDGREANQICALFLDK